MRRVLFLVLGLSLSGVQTLDAQDSEADETGESDETDENLDQAARLTFQSAREAFSQGDYPTALARFEQAYSLSNRPVLLYNIAVTLDRLRRDEEALAKFREYLERVPGASDRTEVEARIRVLEQAIATRQANEPDPDPDPDPDPIPDPDPDPEPEPEESNGLHPAIFLGVAGAALVAGGLIVWSGVDATNRNDDYEAYATSPGATFDEARSMYDDVRSAEKRTNALIGVAAGLGAGAVALAIFTDWSFGGGSDDETAPVVSVGPGHAVLGARGTF